MEESVAPPEKDKWALITTYKVLEPADINFQFMETYINFYRKKWNVTKEILLVGVPEELIEKDYLTQIASRIAGPLVADLSNIDKANFSVSTQFNVQTNIPIDPFFRDIHYHSSPKTDVIFYTTNYSTSNEEWDIIKNTLYTICNRVLDPSYNRVINIDNDEFLFLDSERPPQVEEWFHFFEHAACPPGTSFDSKQDLLWCPQPWYCRRKRLSDLEEKTITHTGCKKYKFARKDMVLTNSTGPSWRHTTHESTSAACNLVDLASANNLEPGDLMPHINRCYHLGVLDEDHYTLGKAIQYSATQTELDSRKAELQELREHYANYYSRDAIDFETIVDNSLQEYWVND